MYYKNFTNLYTLSRTIRFELKWLGKTKELLSEEYEIFPKDKRIEEIYQNIIKPCLNDLHSDFIEKNLEEISLNSIPENILEIFLKDDFSEIQKKLTKEISTFLKNWKIFFTDNIDNLFWKNAIDIIIKVFWEKIYKKDNSEKIFLYEDLIWKTYEELINTYFKGFTTYLQNFNTNRKNLYDSKSEWKKWSITWRIVYENFPKFLQNSIKFKEKIEKNNFLSDNEKEIFKIKNFEKYLSQKWIDNYNKKVWTINSKINEYNQKNYLKWNQKIPKISLLYKQILWKSENENILNFVNNIIENDFELKEEILIFSEISNKKINFIKENILNNFSNFNLEKIFIKRNRLKDLSNLLFTNYSVLEKLLPEITEEWKILKSEEIVSFEEIKKTLEDLTWLENIFKDEYFEKWKNWFEIFLNWILKNFFDLEKRIKYSFSLIQEKVLKWNFIENIKNNEKHIELENWIITNEKWIIKIFLDDILIFDKFIHFFDKSSEIIDFDYNFYDFLEEYSFDFNPFKVYNSIRNYLTKKNYSTEKIKLNFNYSDFLKWNSLWKYAFIYRDLEKNYYLWILKNSISKKNYKAEKSKENTWFQMLEYKQIKFNTLAWKWYIRDFWKKYSEAPNFMENLKILIKKQYIQKYPVLQEIIDLKTETKKEFDGKVKEVLEKAYEINFVNIDKNYIFEENEKWNLYLFQIYNKDFSEFKKKKSKENLHTMYFKALFDDENFKNWACFKLNSYWAEIFFREKSIKEKKLKDLNIKNENIIEKNRFTENKILFHLPITLNFINKKKSKINDEVKKYIKENKMKIIWIDRWEKHLLYFSLIDENWKIYEIKSLNNLIIKVSENIEKEIKYFEKLEEKEWNRAKERKNWDEIEIIKELKEWYISQIVDIIAKLAVNENAIIVMEDLNSWFKKWRQKIEKQIYQKFELALAKKLNFFIDKNKEKNETWWLFKALQLTPKIENFQDIKIQTWIIFYTQAAYTSITCPNCGFRKNIYQKYENEEKFKNFFKKSILDIKFDHNNFIIKYRIDEKKDSKKNILKKLEFELHTKNQERIISKKNEKNKWFSFEKINITSSFKQLFESYKLDFFNLKNEILNWTWEVKLYKDFIFFFNLLLQIRNSETWDNWWFISCPCCSFHSDNWFNWFNYNWDANWAYNIARKWKIILDKIRNNEKNLWITNVEWDNFVYKNN